MTPSLSPSLSLQDLYGLINSTLTSILLLSTSTLVAIILIIQTELEPRKLQSSTKSTNLLAGIKGSIGLSWLLPILCAMCTQLVHNIIGEWPKEWWLKLNTFDFVLFIITEMLFVLLFLLLFLTLIKKLLYLARKRDKHSAAIVKR